MKRLMIGGLSVLLLSAVTAPATMAQITENDGGITNSEYGARQTEPFTLVTSAYRGRFKEQGIPSYGDFISAYQTRRFDAESLVQAAVEAGQLPPQTLDDEGYINAVRLSLNTLISGFIRG